MTVLNLPWLDVDGEVVGAGVVVVVAAVVVVVAAVVVVVVWVGLQTEQHFPSSLTSTKPSPHVLFSHVRALIASIGPGLHS